MHQRSESRPVWDLLVRVLHLGLIVGVASAWITRHGGGPWHEWIGYALMLALVVRLLWGFAGPASARFARFVHGPATTLAYAAGVARGDAPRHIGHNPLGAWMIVALLSLLAVISASGWLSTTDRYWGVAWVMNVHLYATWALLALLPLHIAGAVHASRKHRENLIASMVHGRKRIASGDDVDL
jgi:cytochrome b